MTYEDLKAYVGARDTSDAYVTACFDEATELVDTFIGDAVVPQVIRDRCVLDVGGRLYQRQKALDGVAQYGDMTGAPTYIARDPMVGAYQILGRYLVVGL